MDFDQITVKDSPGLCRCCLSEGCYKDLAAEYNWMGDNEVYADMLLECFDIGISQHMDGPNGPSRLICEVCITRLRDACNFKKQVVASEKKFIDMLGRGEFQSKVMVYEADMKVEPPLDLQTEDGDDGIEYLEEIDFDDDEPLKNLASTSKSAEISPTKRGRGRPKKSEGVPEKKPKTSKDDQKKVSKNKTIVKEYNPADDKTVERSQARLRKDALRNILATLVANTTVLPFKWYGQRYMCFYCQCNFENCEDLKSHSVNEHEEVSKKTLEYAFPQTAHIKIDVSNLACKLCDSTTKRLSDLIQHLSNHGIEFEDNLSFLTPFVLNDNGMACIVCGAEFRFFQPLLNHHHKKHLKNMTHLCDICGAGFASKLKVDSHVKKTHTKPLESAEKLPSRVFKCSKCDKDLVSKYRLQRHLALVHDDKKSQHCCKECPLIFVMKCKLDEHRRRVHLKERKFDCQICDYKAFNPDHLKRHMVKHSDSRPFSCEHCEKSFQRKRTLEFHRRTHTNDRRYSCHDCKQAFVQIASLKRHLQIHCVDGKV